MNSFGLAGLPQTVTTTLRESTFRGRRELSALRGNDKLVVANRASHSCHDGETWVLRPSKRIASNIVLCDLDDRLFDENGHHQLTIDARPHVAAGNIIAVWSSRRDDHYLHGGWAATATLTGVSNDRENVVITYQDARWRGGKESPATFIGKATLTMPVQQLYLLRDYYDFRTVVWLAADDAPREEQDVRVKFLDRPMAHERDIAENILFQNP